MINRFHGKIAIQGVYHVDLLETNVISCDGQQYYVAVVLFFSVKRPYLEILSLHVLVPKKSSRFGGYE